MKDRGSIQRTLEQTRRLSMLAGDDITRQRLLDYRNELIEVLQSFSLGRDKVSEDSIRERARELWEQDGRPQGRDEEFWFRAERELIEASKDSPSRQG